MTITWGVVAAIIALIWKRNAGFMFQAAAITTVCLLSAIHTANFLFGFGGGFVERFPRDQAPPHAADAFSWSEYWREMLRLFGIVVALFILISLIKLPSLLSK
jgi:hypothetical protein